jgi:hypothetical protein
MPRNVIGQTPFPLRVIDTDSPLSVEQVLGLFQGEDAATILVRSVQGPARRGGYFFHAERSENLFQIFDFERNPIAKLDSDHLTRFINHASGRRFDDEMLLFCQSVVNFRLDQTETA